MTEAAAWQRVRETLPSGPVAMPVWLPASIDRTTVELRDLSSSSYAVAYRGATGTGVVFVMGPLPLPPVDAGVGIRVRRSAAALSFPQSVFSDPSAKVLRRVQWQEGDRGLRIESEVLRSDDLVRIAWSLDLTTAPASAHAYRRDRKSACAAADPEGTIRSFLALAGSRDQGAVLDCYALEWIDHAGTSAGSAWAEMPKATLNSVERRLDVAGRIQLLVTWTFASDPGGPWGTQSSRFVILTVEDGVYRIADIASAPLGPLP